MTSQITVVLGNIVRQNDCDAIVNSANQNLRAGSGVSGAIYRAAGPLLEPFSVQLAPLDLGEAVATPGFDLPNRLIVHVRGPKYLLDANPSENLAKAIRNVIRVAEAEGVRKLAVPAISMGIYHYPPDEAVPILVNEAKGLAKEARSIEEIRFVVRDESIYQLFLRFITKR